MSQQRDTSLRARYLAWEQHHGEPGCPVCGRGVRLVTVVSAPRHHVVHDYGKHQRMGVPHVGLPMRRSDEQMYKGYGSWKERRKRQREVEAQRKASMMRARAADEPTESERRAKRLAKEYVEQQASHREAG